ncbi:MAG TPA: transcriptional repressor LexA [Myxococcales bacterium]|jgi:repressor LexA|nr:transcriptional repressor LexA [Myxococcales bacterium]
MTEPLTERQDKILSFIKKSIQDQGYPPTIREIGEHFGIRSTNGVNDHLKALERKGYLMRGELKSRALSVIEGGRSQGPRFAKPSARRELTAVDGGEVVEIPLLGKVAAGEPMLAQENITDHVRIDSMLLGESGRRVFALRVSGDSMIGDGIFDGDYIFVRKQPQADSGEIVVAMIDDEATVKRYYPEGDRIRFQPSNPRHKPIYVSREEFRETQILGLVVGVYRKMN